ncbi:MAG: GNAT family N-acetyltransferase [Burkholderiales bacterium]|nr:GNAT family N-acetyltransferase [Burkholderiales bacterium]
MRKSSGFTVRTASWSADRAVLQELRRAVFIVEQHVPEELEWDEADALSLHALAHDHHGLPVGTGRLLPDGRVGRMAVLRGQRGRGAGSAILEYLIGQARLQGLRSLQLHAQTHAIGFYAQQGFVVQGGEFMEAGIPHRLMRLSW